MRYRLLALVLLLASASSLAAQAPQELRVMTFNLRYASPTPPHAWPQRLPIMRDLIAAYEPDVIGTQEGLYGQLKDLRTALPGYDWIGQGREGGSHSEFMAIFYRKARLEPVEYGHFWLSDTPELIGSRTWGNSYLRMVTWVRFRDRVTGREFYHVNTHLDNDSQPSRVKSAELILKRVRDFDPKLPVVLTGDFNSDAATNPVHDVLTGPNAFIDTWNALGLPAPAFGTFHDFGGVQGAKGTPRIDWILVRGAFTPLSTEIITFQENGEYPSDHFPVLARLKLQ